jgi:ribulose-phosphate 3-epimerase
VHPEVDPHIHRTLQQIRNLGKKPGLAINPATPLAHVETVLDLVDLVLMMSVNPGFGGQEFIEGTLPRIEKVAETATRNGLDIILEVDGGINQETAPRVRDAGATALVAGTAVFRSPGGDYEAAMNALRAPSG